MPMTKALEKESRLLNADRLQTDNGKQGEKRPRTLPYDVGN